MNTYQEFIDKLRAEFPQHHVTLKTWPAGGELDVEACNECGSSVSYSELWRIRPHVETTLDEAVAAIKAQIAAAPKDHA